MKYNRTVPLGIPTKLDENYQMYHWSPRERRESIQQLGLKPGSFALQGTWKPPYVAFATSPTLAWTLSALSLGREKYKQWDLWMTWSYHLPKGWESIFDDDEEVREFRVYYRIPPTKLWFVGTRKKSDG